MVCTILLFLPKGNSGTQGVGLLEFMWKAVEAVIYTQFKTAEKFHGVLHGFRDLQGTGTAIMELKIQILS